MELSPGGSVLAMVRASPAAHVLLFGLLLGLGCTAGPLKFGKDTDAGSGTDTDTTTGEPAPAGVLEWSTIHKDIAGIDLAVAADGSLIVIGQSGYNYEGGDGGSFTGSWIGKFDPAGALLWAVETPHEPGSYRSPVAVTTSPGGDIFVAFVDYAVLEGEGNVVERLDPAGEVLWTATLPARASALAATVDGVIVGGSRAVSGNNGVGWVQALDGAGAPIWDRDHGDPSMRSSLVSAVAVDGDAVILGGRRGVDPASTRAQAWLHRADRSTGAELWDQTLGDAVATDEVHDVGVAADGTIVALGWSDAAFVRAFDPGGAALWSIESTELIGARSLAVAADGSFALTDGLYLDIDDPDACTGPFSPCPVRLQLERREPEGALRWSATSDVCRAGQVAAVTPNDRIVVLADCAETPISDVAMGLLMYAP